LVGESVANPIFDRSVVFDDTLPLESRFLDRVPDI
jgi:hypothetical protein